MLAAERSYAWPVTKKNEQLDLLKTKYKDLLKKLADIEMSGNCKKFYTPLAREAGLLLELIKVGEAMQTKDQVEEEITDQQEKTEETGGEKLSQQETE